VPSVARVPRLDRPSSASGQTPPGTAARVPHLDTPTSASGQTPPGTDARVPHLDTPTSASGQTATSPDAAETLADAFRAVSRLLRHQTQRALAPWEVTPSQARALGVLTRHGPMRLGALSEQLNIAPRSATEVVDTLAAAGLVERRPDPADRRATLVTLMARGDAVAGGIRAARAAEADDFFSRLDDGERATLAAILAKLRG
jgi:DNA-binding MarR family transcriptional regulator